MPQLTSNFFEVQYGLGLARATLGAVQHAMLVYVHVVLKCILISRLYFVNYSTYYYANRGIQIVEEQYLLLCQKRHSNRRRIIQTQSKIKHYKFLAHLLVLVLLLPAYKVH